MTSNLSVPNLPGVTYAAKKVSKTKKPKSTAISGNGKKVKTARVPKTLKPNASVNPSVSVNPIASVDPLSSADDTVLPDYSQIPNYSTIRGTIISGPSNSAPQTFAAENNDDSVSEASALKPACNA